MKCLIKPIGFLALLLFSSQAFSQGNGWSLGVGAGYMNYYGDLTPKLGPVLKDHYKIKANDRSLDFAVFLERKLNDGTNFVINANMGSFKGNDLTASDDSIYIYRDRSLNFRTEVKDLSGTLHFKTNNGSLLPQNSIIAPYFFVGLGVTQFETFGDLKYAQGNLYDYGGVNEVEQDGEYETNLSDLKVEKDAKQTIMNIPFGAGIRFNTGKNWSLNLQTDVKYMFTDYLDDVAKIYRDGNDFESNLQEYASNPNPRNYTADSRGKSDGIKNDLYMFTSLSLRFNFGRKRSKAFVPPIFPPSGNNVQKINNNDVANKEDGSEKDGSEVANETASPVVTEAAPTKEEMQAEVAAMIEEQMAKQAEEVEAEKEAVTNSNNGTGMMQGQQGQYAAPGNYGGSGYDPTVEMLKLEVDRLRSENSLLKIGGSANNNGYNNGYNNQSMGNQPMNGNSANGNFNNNNGMTTNGSAQNGGQTNGNGTVNSNGVVMDANGNAVQSSAANNGNGQNVEKEKKKGLKKIFGGKSKEEKEAKKAEKKAKKQAKKAAKNGNSETGEAEEKDGIFGKIFNRNSDSVNVEEYSFNFVGDSFEMGDELQSQLKKIAKKANKADDGQLIIKAETTKANQAKTNTIGVKLAQILAEEYGVDAGRISYDIKDVDSSPNSNEENQKVSIKLIY